MADSTNNTYFLGFDGGTESMRVGIFDPAGNPVNFESVPYETDFPRSGWAEQQPGDWWSSLCEAVNGAIGNSQVEPEQIAGIGYDTTSCTVVFLDGNMEPLRSALLWMDVRASDQARRIGQSGHDALKYNGYGNVSPEWMPCKALWVKEHQPEIYEKAEHVCEYTDYMTYRLTGRLTANIQNTSVRWYYNNREGGFPEDFYEQIGLGDLIPKFPSPVLPIGELVGELTEDAARQLGLVPGIPVAQGGVDAFVGMLGLNVVEPGRLGLITGSSHLQVVQSEQPIHTRGLFGSYPDAVIDGLHMLEGGQISSGSIVNWFTEHFCGDVRQEAEQNGESLYDLLNRRAGEIPPGSEGLIVLDHWQGNRTPYTDPNSRGAIWGLSLSHRPHHLFRAMMEGVCYGTENILERMRSEGLEVDDAYACGGPTQSDLWMQIHADVSNIPINRTRVADAPTLGSAIMASVASDYYGSLNEAAGEMVHVEDRVEPNPEAHEKYQFYFDQYVRTYEQLSEQMHEVVGQEEARSEQG